MTCPATLRACARRCVYVCELMVMRHKRNMAPLFLPPPRAEFELLLAAGPCEWDNWKPAREIA